MTSSYNEEVGLSTKKTPLNDNDDDDVDRDDKLPSVPITSTDNDEDCNGAGDSDDSGDEASSEVDSDVEKERKRKAQMAQRKRKRTKKEKKKARKELKNLKDNSVVRRSNADGSGDGDDDNDNDDDDGDDGSDVDSTAGMEVPHADALKEDAKNGKKEKEKPLKIEPLKKPLLKTTLQGDEHFEASFVPLDRDGDYTIGIVFALVIVVPDETMNKKLIGVVPAMRALGGSHSCEIDTHVQLLAKIYAKSNNLSVEARREHINRSREMLKVELTGEQLQPKLVHMFVALKQSSLLQCAVTLTDVRSPSLVYRVRLRLGRDAFSVDNFGTFNFPRAFCRADVSFDKLQPAMEAAIPISHSEYMRYCLLPPDEERCCLSSIPLLHNCVGRFEFVSLAGSPMPPQAGMVMNMKLPSATKSTQAALDVAKSAVDNMKIDDAAAAAVVDAHDAAGDPHFGKSLSGVKGADAPRVLTKDQMLGPREERGHNESDDDDFEREDLVVTNEGEILEGGGGRGADDDDIDDDIYEAVNAAANGAAPPPGLIEENQVHANGGSEVDNAMPPPPSTPPPPQTILRKEDIAKLNDVHGMSEAGAERRLLLDRDFCEMSARMVRVQKEATQFYRPLSWNIIYASVRGVKMTIPHAKSRQLFAYASPDEKLTRVVLAMSGLSAFDVAPRYVSEWSETLGLPLPKPGTAEKMHANDAARAVNEFAMIGNKCIRSRSKNSPPSSMINDCLRNLGYSYPRALGFIFERNAAYASKFATRSVYPLRGATKAMLPFALEKIIGPPSDSEQMVDNLVVEEFRRYWAPLLPEQFWRVAMGVGFRAALRYLHIGQIDDAFSMIESDNPHLLVLSHEITAFKTPTQIGEPDPNADAARTRFMEERRGKKARMFTNEDRLLASAPFQLTVHAYTGLIMSNIKMCRLPNFFPSMLALLANGAEERRRILRAIAYEITVKRPYLDYDETFQLLECALDTYVALRAITPLRDRVQTTRFLVRDRAYFDLFYPNVANCAIAMSEMTNDSEPSQVRAELLKLDKRCGFKTSKERWAQPECNVKPVYEILLCTKDDYDISQSVLTAITGPAFAKFGVDVVRCDTVQRMITLTLQRIAQFFIKEGEENVRLHFVLLPSLDDLFIFDGCLAEYKKQTPCDFWDYVMCVPQFSTSNATLLDAYHRYVHPDFGARVIRPDALTRKAYLYIVHAEMISHTELVCSIWSSCTAAFSRLLKSDCRWYDPALTLLESERKLLDAMCGSPLTVDAETRAALNATIARGMCADYLYVTGLALSRGDYFEAQVCGPSAFEDLFFSCAAGDCQPAVLAESRLRAPASRLRSWYDYSLGDALQRMTDKYAILQPCAPLAAELKIKFVNPAERDKLEITEAAELDVECGFDEQPSGEFPRNVWLESALTADGTTNRAFFGYPRKWGKDKVISRRIGLVERKEKLAIAEPHTSRLIFADDVFSTKMLDNNETSRYMKSKSWSYWRKMTDSEARTQQRAQEQAQSRQLSMSAIQRQSSVALDHPDILLQQQQQQQQQHRLNGVDGDVALTPHDLCIDLTLVSKATLTIAVADGLNRFRAYQRMLEKREVVAGPRWIATNGFSIRELIAVAARPPVEVVVGGSWAETHRRLFELYVVPSTSLITACESGLDEHPLVPSALRVLDCYTMNYITSLPYMAMNIWNAESGVLRANEALFA